MTASPYKTPSTRIVPVWLVTASSLAFMLLVMIAIPADGVEISLKLPPGVPVTVRIADVSPSLPEFVDLPAQITSPLRTGYGGGHGIDSMTLIHREYTISPVLSATK